MLLMIKSGLRETRKQSQWVLVQAIWFAALFLAGLTVTVIVVVLLIVNQNYCHLLSEIDIDRLQISQQDLRILEILALRWGNNDQWSRLQTINSEFNIWQMYCYTMVILMILLIIIAAIMFVIILWIMMIMTMILRNNAEWERRQEQHRLRVQWEDEKRDRETRRSWSSSALLSSLGLSTDPSNIIVTLY